MSAPWWYRLGCSRWVAVAVKPVLWLIARATGRYVLFWIWSNPGGFTLLRLGGRIGATPIKSFEQDDAGNWRFVDRII